MADKQPMDGEFYDGKEDAPPDNVVQMRMTPEMQATAIHNLLKHNGPHRAADITKFTGIVFEEVQNALETLTAEGKVEPVEKRDPKSHRTVRTWHAIEEPSVVQDLEDPAPVASEPIEVSAEPAREMDVPQDVLDTIVYLLRKHNDLRPNDLCTLMGIDEDQVQNALTMLERQGKVVSTTTGKRLTLRWKLTPQESGGIGAETVAEPQLTSTLDQWGIGVHPVALVFPAMPDEDFEALKKDIAENGQREPIYMADNLIVDGRHRYRACRELGIHPWHLQIPEGETLIGFCVSKNLHRRHLTAGQRAILAVKIMPFYEVDARKRQLANLKQNQDPTSQTPESRNFDSRGKTAADLAESYDTSRDYILQARRLVEENPALAESVVKGEKSMHKAVQEAKDATEETPPHPGGAGPVVSGALPGLEEEGRSQKYASHPEHEREKDTFRNEPTYKKRKGAFLYGVNYEWDEAGQRLVFTLVRPAVPDKGLKEQRIKGFAIAGKQLTDLGFRLPVSDGDADAFEEDLEALPSPAAPTLDFTN